MHDPEETRLWRAVMLQAFADSAAPKNAISANSARANAQRRAARAWLTQPSRDLFDVCRFALEDMNQVIATARRLKDAGWPDVIEGHHRTHPDKKAPAIKFTPPHAQPQKTSLRPRISPRPEWQTGGYPCGLFSQNGQGCSLQIA